MKLLDKMLSDFMNKFTNKNLLIFALALGLNNLTWADSHVFQDSIMPCEKVKINNQPCPTNTDLDPSRTSKNFDHDDNVQGMYESQNEKLMPPKVIRPSSPRD